MKHLGVARPASQEPAFVVSPERGMSHHPAVAGLPAPGRCLVVGILNVTPDSFSDGGCWLDVTAAVAYGHELHLQGADIVDVGGESTRPGAARVDVDEELRRVLPVIRELARTGVVVSVDTTRATVARAALDAGAVVVNDVSGGLADLEMLAAVAAAGVPYILMHSRGPSSDMQQRAVYEDVVADVSAELDRRREAAHAAGIDARRLILDPGLGFAKTAEHNWQLLARLDELLELGAPLLVGASRKGFLGDLLADAGGVARGVADRDDATTAVSAIAAHAGAWGVRVHDVAATADAVRVAAAVRQAASTQGAR